MRYSEYLHHPFIDDPVIAWYLLLVPLCPWRLIACQSLKASFFRTFFPFFFQNNNFLYSRHSLCAFCPSFETCFSFSERRRYAIEWKNLRQKNLWTHLATLDARHGFNRRKIRWSLAAQDICFTNVWHSYFFMLGKCIPIVRGDGVYQEAVDFCIERLALGEWVHVFPEGKVNMLKEEMRFVLKLFS